VSLPQFFHAWPQAWLALVFAHLGRFSDAIARADDAVRIAESAGHPHTVIEAYGALGGVRLEKGDLTTALRAFEKAMELLRARNARDPNTLSGLGYVYALSGRVGDGLSLLDESVVGEASISAMGLGLAVRLGRLAAAYEIAGRADEGADRARSALDTAHEHKERANEASALRMRPLIAHLHAGVGRLYGRMGNQEQAAGQVGIAATMYRELGMNGWLERLEQERS